MITHEPSHGLGFLGVEAQTRTKPLGYFAAQFRMLAAAALRDVVEQKAQIEHAARQHLVDDLAGQGMIFAQEPALDAREDADGADRVLVHRVHVIHVVLHLRDDAAEIGNEAAEHAGLVEPPQRGLRPLGRGQHLEEQAVGLGVGAQARIHQLQVPRDELERIGMDVEVALVRQVKQAQQIDGIALERILRRDGQALAFQREALQRRHGLERRALVLGLDRRAEDARQIAHRLGGQEIVLHEALDAERARVVGITQPAADLGLHVEGQKVSRAAGQIVQMAAQGP